MIRTSYALASLVLSLTSAATAFAQNPLASGTRVTVAMVDSITTLNLGASYSATVSMGLPGSANVPQGSPAVVKVVQNTGYPVTYSLQLASLTINGQTTAVTGGSPILNAAGTAINNATTTASNAVGNAVNRMFGGGKQPQAKPAANVNRTPSVSGTRIFVPSSSSVMFTLTTALPAQTAQGQPAAAGGQPAAAGPNATTQTTSAGSVATSSTVVYEQIQYQLTGCQRQAPHIICSVTVTNLRGGDVMLNGAGGAYYIDQSGNRVVASMRSLANCAGWGACQMLPNIAMAGKWEFIDQDNHATTLVRLQIAEDGKPVAQFSQVPVQ